MAKQVLSVKMRCPKCEATAYHTLVDGINKIYRCNVCGNLTTKKK